MSWEQSYAAIGGGSGGNPRREFFIQSEMNNKVLDVRGGNQNAGIEVVMYDLHTPPKKNQLWYLDPQGMVHSALNDMVFYSPVKGQPLKMQPPSGDNRDNWRFDGTKVVNEAGECLDIQGESSSNGANVCAYDYKSKKNQHWRQLRDFYIVSQLHNLVVDIRGAKSSTGTNIVMYKKNSPPSSNQLWYMDTQGYLYSAMNNLAFGASAKGNDLQMQNPGVPRNQWRVEGEKIMNGEGWCLDIKGASTKEGADLCGYDYKKQKNQHWRLEYA